MDEQHLVAELVAVVVAVVAGRPTVLAVPALPDEPAGLPAGPLQAGESSLQASLRSWVASRTGRQLGYVEQLYTFADADRGLDDAARRISVSYLGLTTADAVGETWEDVYSFLPWEDQRRGTRLVDEVVAPQLTHWVGAAGSPEERLARRRRCDLTFGRGGQPWVPELALQRYELLYEVGLLPESREPWRLPADDLVPGERMIGDHRRILATGLARLRTKIQYRPVVFELMAPEFTLGQLQSCVEALAGQVLHKQNFRRLVEQQALVEETGARAAGTGGRPARLYRFRRSVLDERQVAGTKLPALRAR
ncbi:NUDIX hydrolase [Arsenicicoccus sp. oral taxon 190]|uniref:NUDIX hydrolase n=1 Tax=Arsenicicoccus sp. oral taxon 190 TaxID=1658671 RepID=UPI00067A1575|nr:hypothetical protein [Arsenicicoccus sp. oral taxon 190]AKT52167.1 membrane protein [Arsenicicoccus sp. oral taxon 190]